MLTTPMIESPPKPKPLTLEGPGDKVAHAVQTFRLEPGQHARVNLPANRGRRTLHVLQAEGTGAWFSFLSASDAKAGDEACANEACPDQGWPLAATPHDMGSLNEMPSLHFGNGGDAPVVIKLLWGWFLF